MDDMHTSCRRQRQLAEIAALVAAGRRERASGLAQIHVSEFPEDVGALASLLDSTTGASS